MKKSRLAIAIGVAPKPGMDDEESSPVAENSPEDRKYDERIGAALQELFDHMKSGDTAAAVEAFEAAVHACHDETPEPGAQE